MLGIRGEEDEQPASSNAKGARVSSRGLLGWYSQRKAAVVTYIVG